LVRELGKEYENVEEIMTLREIDYTGTRVIYLVPFICRTIVGLSKENLMNPSNGTLSYQIP
jgi:hypothetical protein